MLHAELHGKLDSTASNLCRIEDILTSTIFGTLLLTDAGLDVLSRWLSLARRFEPDGRLGGPIPPVSPDLLVLYWFWPNLTEAEPDLVVRIGERLFVIEAKYYASMGQGDDEDDTADDDVEPLPSVSGNQLARQWRSCQAGSARFFGYPSDLQAAIAECEMTLVYLVSADHHSRAVAELCSSWNEIGPASGQQAQLCLLTWQDLHRDLVLQLRHLFPTSARWVSELALLLTNRKLAAFIGFPQALEEWRSGTTDVPSAWAANWTVPQTQVVSRTLDSLNLQAVARIAKAEWWVAASWSTSKRETFSRALNKLNLPAISRVALAEWWLRKPASLRSVLAGLNLDAVHVVASSVWRRATSATSGEGT